MAYGIWLMVQDKNKEGVSFHEKPYAPRLMPYACFYLTNPLLRQTVFLFPVRQKKGRAFRPAPLTVSAVMSSYYFTKGAGIG